MAETLQSIDPAYLIIAAAIILLPFALSRLLSGRSSDAKTVLGASRSAPAKPPGGKEQIALAKTVLALFSRGKKVDAIKLMQARTGMTSEATAKMATLLERLEGAGHAAVTDNDPIALLTVEDLAAVRTLLARDQIIEAVKRVRDRTGVGLREAKDIVERLRSER